MYRCLFSGLFMTEATNSEVSFCRATIFCWIILFLCMRATVFQASSRRTLLWVPLLLGGSGCGWQGLGTSGAGGDASRCSRCMRLASLRRIRFEPFLIFLILFSHMLSKYCSLTKQTLLFTNSY